MTAKVSIRTRGLSEFTRYIDGLARNSRGVATESVSDYLIGDGRRGLKRYPSYRYIRRSQVYKPPFKSNRQRRFVMAGIRSGSIQPGYPHRTGRFQRAWIRLGTSTRSRIQGEEPHENWPDPLARRVGWRAKMEIIASNLRSAVRYAEKQIVKMRR